MTFAAEHPPAPARVRLPRLAPVIIIDTREQRPLAIEAFSVKRVGLPVGDYGILGFSDWSRPAFICERKGIDDLVGGLTAGRERFMREVEKMRAFQFRALLIEARREQVELGHYVSSATPQSILATLDALAVRAGLHIFWCDDPEGAARQLEGLVRQFVRGIEKAYRALLANRAEDGPTMPVAGKTEAGADEEPC